MKGDHNSLKSIHWEAPEFPYREKTPLWYTNVMVFYGLVVLLFFFIGNYYAILITSLLFWYFLSQANEKPRVVSYKIDVNGITIGDRLITYTEIRSLSVDTVGRLPVVTLDLTHTFSLPLILMVKKHDFEEIIDALMRYVPLEQRFSFMQWISNRLHY